MKLISHIDVERNLDWYDKPEGVEYFDCYNNALDIAYTSNKKQIIEWFSSIFNSSFLKNKDGCWIKLEATNRLYPIYFNKIKYNVKRNDAFHLKTYKPLFETFYTYKDNTDCSIETFNYAANLAQEGKKVLVIDGNIHSPGLSFLYHDYDNMNVSFQQFIETLHYTDIDDTDKVIDYFAKEIKSSSTNSNIYILSTYIDLNEGYNKVIVVPNFLNDMRENQLALNDYIFILAEKLEVNYIIMELESGYNKTNNSFLSDRRIIKNFVTTTNKQSAYGLKILLKSLNFDYPVNVIIKYPNDDIIALFHGHNIISRG